MKIGCWVWVGLLTGVAQAGPRVTVPTTNNKVIEMAEFAVSEFIEHVFRTERYRDDATYEILSAEKSTVNAPHDPTLSSMNFWLDIRVLLDGCSVHSVHVIHYPQSKLNVVNTRSVDESSSECNGYS